MRTLDPRIRDRLIEMLTMESRVRPTYREIATELHIPNSTILAWSNRLRLGGKCTCGNPIHKGSCLDYERLRVQEPLEIKAAKGVHPLVLKLIQARNKVGVTSGYVCEKSKIPHSTLKRSENGWATPPLLTLVTWAATLGYTLELVPIPGFEFEPRQTFLEQRLASAFTSDPALEPKSKLRNPPPWEPQPQPAQQLKPPVAATPIVKKPVQSRTVVRVAIQQDPSVPPKPPKPSREEEERMIREFINKKGTTTGPAAGDKTGMVALDAEKPLVYNFKTRKWTRGESEQNKRRGEKNFHSSYWTRKTNNRKGGRRSPQSTPDPTSESQPTNERPRGQF